MTRVLFIALILSSLPNCTKVTNNINEVELSCGESSDPINYRYIKLFNNSGELNSSQDLQVRGEGGQDWSQLLTPKGCLKVPKDLEKKLIVARPGANEGFTFFPQRVALGRVQPFFVKSFRYQSLNSPCQTDLATNALAITWPLDFNGVATDSYDWHLTIKRQNVAVLDIRRTAAENLNSETIDLASLKDGSYKLTVEAKQLFSKDKVESKFECNLVVDRESPAVTLDRESVRIGDDDEPSLQAAPGEAVKIQTAGSQSVDTIYACLRPEKSPADVCTYDQVTTGYVTAPQKGSWYLRLYAQDQAGNIGPISERKLQVFDSNLVSNILSLINQSSLAQKAGNSIYSLALAVKSYERMLSLGSKAETASVLAPVRKAILESSAVAVEELVLRVDTNAGFRGLAVSEKNAEPLYLQGSMNILEGFHLNGKKNFSLDLGEALKLPPFTVGYQFCQRDLETVATGGAEVAFFKNDMKVATFPIPDAKRISIGSISSDCRYVFLFVTKSDNKESRYVLDRQTGDLLSVPNTATNLVGLWSAADSRKLILKGADNWYFLYDFSSNAITELTDLLGMKKISQIKKAMDGTTGIVSSEQVFSIVDQEGKTVLTIENVTDFYTTTIPGEYVVIRYGYNAEFYSSAGVNKGVINVNAPNWSYLNATGEFMVGMTAGSNVVKIWTRAGNFFDEIYNKGDSIQSVFLSADGFLHVGSSQFNKLYRLNSGFSKKHLPQYQNALGLQFTSDGKNLLYKDQQSEFLSGDFFASNRLVNWNLETDERQAHDLPQVPFSSLQYPGYGFQTLDLQYFSQDGQKFLASTVKRGSVAIYQADKLDLAVEDYGFGTNWLLDIAIDPNGDLIAAASQDGSVYLVNRTTKARGQTRLDAVYTQYFQEYPVTVTFDATGRFLFVTDLNDNLIKYAVDLNETKDAYTLTPIAQVGEAGDRLVLSPKGDQLALVGSGVKLNIFDTNLKSLQTFELSSTSANIVQSVTYSPDGNRVYAGLYGGLWSEVDLKSGHMLKVRFSSSETGIFNLVVAPQGDRVAFMGGGFVQVADLNVDRVYTNICSWLAPRLPYIPDLSDEDRKLCRGAGAP